MLIVNELSPPRGCGWWRGIGEEREAERGRPREGGREWEAERGRPREGGRELEESGNGRGEESGAVRGGINRGLHKRGMEVEEEGGGNAE